MLRSICNTLICLLITLTPLGTTHALNTELPDLGNSASSAISPQKERELGRAFMRRIRQSNAVLNDPLIVDYIQYLGTKLVQESSHAGQSFDFFVIDNGQINAFAGPAGHIGVYSGLILTTQSESELAAVLAHEIAHVTQQHLLRAWEAANDMAVPNAAILLAALALGLAAGGDAGIAAATTGQAALIQQQINFTRANEKEADRIGIEILAKAGYEPRAMPAFFSRMGKANRIYFTKVPEFLLTHPVTTSRIADSLGRATEYPYVQGQGELRYLLSRTLLREITSPSLLPSLTEYEHMLEEGRYRIREATEFGYALALRRAGRTQQARTLLAALAEKHPEQPEFLVKLADLEASSGQTQQALNRIQTALLNNPSSYALNTLYADLATLDGQHELALKQLRTFLNYRSLDPNLYKRLAKAADGAGQHQLANEYQALYHYTDGRLEQAILQIEIALRAPELSFFERSKLESRLQNWRKELRAQKKAE